MSREISWVYATLQSGENEHLLPLRGGSCAFIWSFLSGLLTAVEGQLGLMTDHGILASFSVINLIWWMMCSKQ